MPHPRVIWSLPAVLLGLGVLGTAVIVAGSRVSWMDAMLWSVSAACTVGLEEPTGRMRWLVAAWTGVGGVVAMSFGVRIVTGRWWVWRVLALAAGAQGLGAALMGGDGWAAVWAFNNAGFGGVDVRAWRTHAVLTPLAVLGGLGVLLFHLKRHRRLVLITSGVLYAAGVVLLWVLPGIGLAEASWLSVTSRSAGLESRSAELLPGGARAVMLALMVCGGSPAGTAGGVMTTVLTLWIAAARGQAMSRVAAGIVAWVLMVAWMGAYALCVADGLSLERALWLSVSATTGCGYGLDQALELTSAGKATIIALMLLGRCGPLMMLAAALAAGQRARLEQARITLTDY